MNERVAPTSFIVWIVNLRAKTLRRTVLLISTNEMKSSKAMNTPSMSDILLRLAFSASTSDF